MAKKPLLQVDGIKILHGSTRHEIEMFHKKEPGYEVCV